jgi:hypothetical protein
MGSIDEREETAKSREVGGRSYIAELCQHGPISEAVDICDVLIGWMVGMRFVITYQVLQSCFLQNINVVVLGV